MSRWLMLFAGLWGGHAFAGEPWQVWTSPQSLAALDASDQVLEVSSRCQDGCRYDRSNQGPEAPADNPFPLRWIYQDAAEAVIFDQRGAGVVTRFWLTSGDGVARCLDPAMRVRIYVDGASIPVLDEPLTRLFDGTLAPFTAPVSVDRFSSSGGYVSRVPIAYQSGLRIALVNWQNGNNPCVLPTLNGWNPLWYQIHFHRLPAGAVSTSFNPAVEPSAWRSFLGHAGDDPWNGMLAPSPVAVTLAPTTSQLLASRSGSGWLRGIRLNVAVAQRALLRLRIIVDGETAVDMALDDFFASAASAERDARSVMTGVDVGGTLYAWWPVPYRQSLSVELVAEPLLASSANVSGALIFDPGSVTPQAGSFRADVNQQCASSGDLSLFAAGGAGKLVGVSARQHANGVIDFNYLEGDERAYADGATTPIWYGTGVEDFYDGGFYFSNDSIGVAPFANPLAGASEVDRTGGQTTATYRLLLTDGLAYANGLRLTQEAGFTPYPNGGVPSCLRHVTYAYTQPRPTAVSYQAFEMETPGATAHIYSAAGASCGALTASYDDEPATTVSGAVCRGNGTRTFRFVVGASDTPLRLRRRYDIGNGVTGVSAGSGAAEIRINGQSAGFFSPAAADTTRRWQQQDAALSVLVPSNGILEFEVVPESSTNYADFSDAAYELIGAWRDRIFENGFDIDTL